MTLPLRCAHISDLHFSHLSWNPSQFLSKRWLGNLNLLFSRQKDYLFANLYSLIDQFKERGITHVFITGDVSTTSAATEFALAQAFVAALKQANLKTFVLPGNHDQYTRSAYRDQLFYQFFDASFEQGEHPALAFNLKRDGLAASRLSPNWWVITLDTAVATSLLSSCGLFSPETEKNLEQLLAAIPADHHIILANHFPFFHNDSPRKILKRGKALRAVIERHPNIRFYIHGHTHRHCIADLRASGLPIVLDSGSTSHKKIGSWNLIDIQENGCTVEPFYCQAEGVWSSKPSQTFTW